ncbi:hypothetical protein RA276_28320, partial [Pseudomonas syringae pv. tagetis]|uniref:hypothetical protein n=1 Tax=Pseudomonas syringae group genomosp. 7 TaxID=251699 RepID=UPI00376FEC62
FFLLFFLLCCLCFGFCCFVFVLCFLGFFWCVADLLLVVFLLCVFLCVVCDFIFCLGVIFCRWGWFSRGWRLGFVVVGVWCVGFWVVVFVGWGFLFKNRCVCLYVFVALT